MTDYFQGITLLAFTPSVIGMLLLLVVLLVCSALASGSETAFFSLTPSQQKELEESDNASAKAAVQLLGDEDRLLSTLLITNNLINIGAILMANAIIDSTVSFGDATLFEFLIKVIIVTFILLLFGEIMPKIFAAAHNKALAERMAIPILTIRSALRPLSSLLMLSGRRVTRALARKHSGISMSELSEAIEIAETESDEDKKMLTGIVRFVRTEVDEIMKPRIDVVAIEIDEPFGSAKERVRESGFSRIPIYGENLDDIRGILYVKDLLPYLSQGDDFGWQKLLRPTYFVPEHKKINDLLVDFQSRKTHIAVVVDEYGGTLGIVSLEDILEEIVGDIADESDTEAANYQQIDNNTYIFEGRTHLGDFLRVLHLPDDFLESVRGESDTIAGLMLEIRGDFFGEGESVNFDNIEFRAVGIESRRITKVRITILDGDMNDAD